MREDLAVLLLDRIAVVAYAIGLDVGAPGCRANLLIFVTSDSDALARYITQEHQVWVLPRGAGCFAYTEEVRDFVETPRPVRWWHVSYARSRYGALAERRCNDDEPPGVEATLGRIGRSTRQEFGRALVIVDARRIAGHHFGAVADYVAMVGLASMNATADTSGFDTILNLFGEDESRRTASLTDWDVSYLEGLYGAARHGSGRTQRDQIARSIARGVTGQTNPQENSQPQ